MPSVHGSRVVVLGGSVAGLCAAAALAPLAGEVVVLERDLLPEGPDHRRGTPQSRHPHFLLNAGKGALEELLPGFAADVIARGGEILDPSYEAAFLDARGWAPRKHGPLTMLFTSRILLEAVLRDRVRALGNVVIREQTDVTGLTFDVMTGRVTGARVVDRSEDGDGTESALPAALVVDALGRASRVATWLQQHTGLEVPVQDLNAKVMYSSRWYQRPSELTEDLWWKQLVVTPAAAGVDGRHSEYLSTIYPVDGDRWIAFMGSWGHDMPSTNEDFEREAKLLRTPIFAEALDRATPLSDVHTTRSTHNRWIRYDQVLPPAGLVAVGDAVCAFNPLYGQGMSAAAKSGTFLRDAVVRNPRVDQQLARSYFSDYERFLRLPWSLATMRDKSYQHASGTEAMADGLRKRVLGRVTIPVFDLINAASREDQYVAQAFAKVFNLEEHAATMGRPRFLYGLLRYRVRSAFGRTRLPASSSALQHPPGRDWSTDRERAEARAAVAAG